MKRDTVVVQECIPVGCVPPATVPVGGAGVAVADLRGVRDACPPGGPNSFNFMQFLGKYGKIICWCPRGVGTPSLGKSWIHHWVGLHQATVMAFWCGGFLVWWPSGVVAFWCGSLLLWPSAPPEGHTRRPPSIRRPPNKKAITEGHNRRPQQKAMTEGDPPGAGTPWDQAPPRSRPP